MNSPILIASVAFSLAIGSAVYGFKQRATKPSNPLALTPLASYLSTFALGALAIYHYPACNNFAETTYVISAGTSAMLVGAVGLAVRVPT